MLGFFFFQAEDGIRDLVRSRGLGDVYKRQERYRTAADTILANSTTKIFMGPVADTATQQLLRNANDARSADPWNDRPGHDLTTAAVRQLARDRALLFTGSSPATVIETRAWWRRRALRRRARMHRRPCVAPPAS